MLAFNALLLPTLKEVKLTKPGAVRPDSDQLFPGILPGLCHEAHHKTA
jgi:hypothetical protein